MVLKAILRRLETELEIAKTRHRGMHTNGPEYTRILVQDLEHIVRELKSNETEPRT